MRVDPRSRHGAALIEALVSLVLLGTVGTSLLMLLGQTRQTLHAVRATELATDSADLELQRLVVHDRDALVRRIGWTVEHGLALHIEQTSRSVFTVAVSREAGLPPLLETTLYRPDSIDAR